MTEKDDFSPVQDSGEFERSGGLLGRWRRRVSLPAVELGTERFLVGDDGEITGGRNVTAGEKFWAKGGRWVTLDLGAHHLSYELPVRDRTGRAAYLVTVEVTAQVLPDQAGAVINDKATSVRPLLLRALREQLAKTIKKETGNGLEPAATAGAVGRETSQQLEVLRCRVEDAIRSVLVGEKVTPLPDWLAAHVASIDVRFDSKFGAHVEKLVTRSHDHALTELDVESKIAIRDMWRKDLAPRLKGADPRMIEAILDDPSPELVRHTVEHMQSIERKHRDEMYSVLQLFIEKNYFTDMQDSEVWKAIGTISRALDPSNTGSGSGPAAREPSTAPRDAIDASAHTTEHPTPSAEGSSGNRWT